MTYVAYSRLLLQTVHRNTRVDLPNATRLALGFGFARKVRRSGEAIEPLSPLLSLYIPTSCTRVQRRKLTNMSSTTSEPTTPKASVRSPRYPWGTIPNSEVRVRNSRPSLTCSRGLPGAWCVASSEPVRRPCSAEAPARSQGALRRLFPLWDLNRGVLGILRRLTISCMCSITAFGNWLHPRGSEETQRGAIDHGPVHCRDALFPFGFLTADPLSRG